MERDVSEGARGTRGMDSGLEILVKSVACV